MAQKSTIEDASAGIDVIWQPYENSSQELFLSCPIFECLYEGSRGPGKTDCLLMDFAQYVGRGFGPAWRGILFREKYPNLDDVITKSLKWFRQIFPDATYNISKHEWTFPEGEKLYFRHARIESDYWNYHGHAYPWVGFDELTNWADDKLYLKLMSICRSTDAGMPRRFRATCNPLGKGHNWVKARFIDPAPRCFVIQDEDGRERTCIHGDISENLLLSKNDPDYIKNIQSQTGVVKQAWLYGDWDIVAGGMFDDVWNPKIHIVKPFVIPETWRIDRSFDWGSSKPYSVGWWAESDGCDITVDGRTRSTKRGDLFRIAELYGWNGKPNEGTKELARDIAVKIRKYEKEVLCRIVYTGPADSSIWDNQDGNCIADKMSAEGVYWRKANKGPGSRINGWEMLRARLNNAITKDGPGLFIFDTCRQFIRTVPVLPRDDSNLDDVDTEAEDHVGDETRYRVGTKVYKASSGSM